jgi:hypothetical protein
MTYEELVRECSELRARSQELEARFLMKLVQVEREHMELLRDAGIDSIERFIESNALTKPARYRAFERGFATLNDADLAISMGVEAVIEAGRLPSGTERVEMFCSAVRDWAAEHRGLLPRMETVKHLSRQIDPVAEMPRASRRQGELRRLQNELARLQAENRKLRERVRELEAQQEVPKAS